MSNTFENIFTRSDSTKAYSLLLPSLLLSLERSIANKETLKEPAMRIIATPEDEEEISKDDENHKNQKIEN